MTYHDSYGIIPLSNRNGKWFVLLIEREQGFWEFPKGHANPSEKPEKAAIRELKEETGLSVIRMLPRNSLMIDYLVTVGGKEVKKVVTYFLAEVEDKEAILQKGEVKSSKWVPLDEAEELITYPSSKVLCRELLYMLK